MDHTPATLCHRLPLHPVMQSSVPHREFHGPEYHFAQIPTWKVIRDKSSNVTTDLRSQLIKGEIYRRAGNEGTKWLQRHRSL